MRESQQERRGDINKENNRKGRQSHTIKAKEGSKQIKKERH